MCFNPSPERRVPSPNRYMAFARFCFCKNNKRTIIILPCRASRGAPLRHPAPLYTPSSCAGPAYARPLLLVLLISRGREHLPAPTPKEPMQGVRGRETGALAPPVRSLASSVADPSKRRRASAARLFVTSKQTPICVRLWSITKGHSPL